MGAWSQYLFSAKALLFGFHTHQSACELSLGLLSYCSSKIAISRVGLPKKLEDGLGFYMDWVDIRSSNRSMIMMMIIIMQ